MRMTHLLLALATVILPLAPIVTATSAAAQAMPCKGTINVIRISEIKPGKMDTFLQAVAAQKAWYSKAGTKDVITVMRIVDQGANKLSDTQAITTHEQDASRGPKGPAHDAGYDAFVALFKDSSDIKTQYITCMVGA